MVDAAAIGNDGTDGDACQFTQIDASVNILMQNADGIVGRNLLGDTVDGTTCAVELSHVDAIDAVARIGRLDGLYLFPLAWEPYAIGERRGAARRLPRLMSIGAGLHGNLAQGVLMIVNPLMKGFQDLVSHVLCTARQALGVHCDSPLCNHAHQDRSRNNSSYLHCS